MKKSFLLIIFCMLYGAMTAHSKGLLSEPDTAKIDTLYLNSQVRSTYDDLNRFFLTEEKNFININMPLYLYSISYEKKFKPQKPPIYIRIGYDYLFPGFIINNFHLGFPIKFRENKFNYFISARFGNGPLNETFYKGKDVISRIGIEGEVESRDISKNFKCFIGSGFGFIYPSQGDAVAEIDPFFGLRYYLIPGGGIVRYAFQVKFGVPFKSGPDLTSVDDYDYYIGAGVNILLKIKRSNKVKHVNYQGEIEVYKEGDAPKLKAPRFEPLPVSEKADTLVERKIYLQGQADVTGMLNIDVSDIKLARFIYDTKSGLDNPSDNFFFTLKKRERDTLVLLIAMFDKERCVSDSISNNNMYLVFNDLNKSRYFGFNYDINNRLQPETVKLDSLDLKGNTPYYGYYKDYIKKLHWLDTDVIPLTRHNLDGKEIESDILLFFDEFNENLEKECESKNFLPFVVDQDHYRFAYSIYPQETFNNVKNACKNFGVSIMFRFDLNDSDANDTEVFGFTKSADGSMFIDPNDAAFFSNLIRGSDIYSPCTGNNLVVDDFDLGKDLLTKSHRDILAKVKAYSCNIMELIGYTDKVEFVRNAGFMNELYAMRNDAIVRTCVSLDEELEKILAVWQAARDANPEALPEDALCQKALAWKRIRSVLAELDNFGFDIENVKTIPAGINPETKRSGEDPGSRKVVIRFSN